MANYDPKNQYKFLDFRAQQPFMMLKDLISPM